MTTVIPGFAPFSEENSAVVKFFHGVVATCVESSELSIDALYGVANLSATGDIGLTQDLISRGQAAWGGATNWLAASQQMARLGIPNTAYGPGGNPIGDLAARINSALAQGIPVLAGTGSAYNLVDVLSGSHPDAGVHGHAIDIVGYDPRGAYVVADPNSAQAASGGYVEYTLSNLQQNIDSLVIPNAPPSGLGGGGGLHTMSFGLGNPLDGLQSVGQFFSGLLGWFTDPLRIVKLVVGSMLVFLGVQLAIFGSIGKPVAVAAAQVGAALS